MDISPRRLGKSELRLTPVGLGGVPVGEIYERIPDEQARATLAAAWDSGVRYFDTSPWYGRGLSELRFGEALRGRKRSDYVLSTKVGRTFHRPADAANFKCSYWAGGLQFEHRFDYTYDGIMRSYDQSLMRLGLNTIDMLLIHDLDVSEIGSPDLVRQHFVDLERSGWRALEGLRRHGEIRAVGAGVNIMGTIPEMLRRFDLDFFLVAMPYTLLDQAPLNEEFPLCARSDVGIVIGAPFASGILATGAGVPVPFYNYLPAKPDIVERVGRIERVCAAHKVPLRAAAAQFPLRHPIVATIIPGAANANQAAENAGLLAFDIPEALWTDLKDQGLIHPLSP